MFKELYPDNLPDAPACPRVRLRQASMHFPHPSHTRDPGSPLHLFVTSTSAIPDRLQGPRTSCPSACRIGHEGSGCFVGASTQGRSGSDLPFPALVLHPFSCQVRAGGSSSLPILWQYSISSCCKVVSLFRGAALQRFRRPNRRPPQRTAIENVTRTGLLKCNLMLPPSHSFFLCVVLPFFIPRHSSPRADRYAYTAYG